MKKLISTAIIAIMGTVFLTACGCKHEWQEATCIAPKTCTLCDATEGDIVDHASGEWEVKSYDYVEAKKVECKSCI